MLAFDDLTQIFDLQTPHELLIEANEIVTSESYPQSLLLSESSPFLSSTQSNQTSNGTNSSAHLLILFNLKNRRPRFSTNNCLASIDEHSNFLSSVRWRSSHQVIDYDYGFNGTFELSIIDPNEIFLITPKIGYQNITFTLLINDSRRLDFETTPNISVIVSILISFGFKSQVCNLICPHQR